MFFKPNKKVEKAFLPWIQISKKFLLELNWVKIEYRLSEFKLHFNICCNRYKMFNRQALFVIVLTYYCWVVNADEHFVVYQLGCSLLHKKSEIWQLSYIKKFRFFKLFQNHKTLFFKSLALMTMTVQFFWNLNEKVGFCLK